MITNKTSLLLVTLLLGCSAVAFAGPTDEQAADIEETLDIQKGWVKSDDGYYYYQNILSNGYNE
mgnify:CR=1 FL=1